MPDSDSEVFEIWDKASQTRAVELVFSTAAAAFAWLEPNIRPERKGTRQPGDEDIYRVQSVRMQSAAQGDIRAALLLHLKQSGFVSYDDGTVALFKGSFAVGEDSVTPVVWTSAERLADTILARFELRDRQAEASGDGRPSEEDETITRLTVNIGPRTAEALNWTTDTYGVSLTEALRRMIASGYLITRKAVDDGVDIRLHSDGSTQDVIIVMPDGR